MKKLPSRQIHLDFHTSPLISGIGSKFDKEEWVNTLKKAKVNGINLFAKCHHGYYYYDTQVGERHPNLDFNLLEEQISACKENNIKVGIYTCVGWNEYIADKHPEWQQVDKYGVLGCNSPFVNAYYKWQNLCLNKRGYRDLLKAEIKEEVERFMPDSYWMDIVVQRDCVCHECRAGMKKLGLDPRNEKDVKKYNRMTELDFMKEFTAYIKSLDENISVFYNSFPSNPELDADESLSTERKRQLIDFVDVESLPSDQWGYTHFPINADFINYRENEPFTMMNGKFHLAWGDFGTLRNIQALEYECFRGYANGGSVCVGDQMHPNGKLCETTYNRIGKVFTQLEEFENKIGETKKVSNVGIMLNNAEFTEINGTIEGAHRIFKELHIPVDFIDYSVSYDKYKLIVLPDNVKLNDKAKDKLNAYLAKGGSLIFSGTSAVENDEFVLNVPFQYKGEAKFKPRYLNISSDNFPQVPPMNYCFYEQGYEIIPSDSTKVLGYITDPYMNREYDKFCSHRQFPPREVSDRAGIVVDGKVAYVAQNIFTEYIMYGNRLCKDIIAQLLSLVYEDNLIECDLPNYVETYLRENDGKKYLYILNYIIQKKNRSIDTIEESVPLFDKEIFLRTASNVQSIKNVITNEEIPFVKKESGILMSLKKIGKFDILEIKEN